jgi:hypothetical protein
MFLLGPGKITYWRGTIKEGQAVIAPRDNDKGLMSGLLDKIRLWRGNWLVVGSTAGIAAGELRQKVQAFTIPFLGWTATLLLARL